MPAVSTSDGQTFYVPDFLAGGRMPPQGLPSLAPTPPPPPPPVDAAPLPPPPPTTLPPLASAPPTPPVLRPDFVVPAPGSPPPAPPGGKASPAPPAGPALPADLAASQKENLAGLEEQKKAQADLAASQERAAAEQAQALEARDKAVADQQAANAAAEKQRQEGIALHQKAVDDSINAFANTKIDDQRRWKNMGTGQKVLAGISVALSGIGQAFMGKGGTNPALDMITQAVRDDVAAQVRDREGLKEVIGAKRTSLDDYMAQTKDLRQAEQMKIAEEYKRTADTIETIGARHRGTDIAANAANLAGQMREQAAKIIGATGQQAYERGVKQQELGIQKAQVGLGYANLAQSDKHFQASQSQALKFHNDEMDQHAAQLALEGRKIEAAALKKQQEQLNNQGFMQPVGVQKNADGSLQPKYDWLKQQDGTPYIAPEKSAEELHKVYSGTVQAIDAIDNLRRMRQESGGDLTKLPAEAKAKVLEYERALIGAHQAAGINGFRGNVMEVMDKALTGGADPTTLVTDLMPLLERARDNAISDLNTKLTKEGNYTGKALSFPDPIKAAAPQKSESDKAAADLLEKPTDLSGGILSPAGAAGGALAKFQAKEQAAGMSGTDRRTIETLGAQVMTDDPGAKERATAMLRQIALHGRTPQIRDLAAKLASGNPGPDAAAIAPQIPGLYPNKAR